ncbi:LysR family transcriptional regulator [Halovulum dunhuangense]|uniref:LysR family transcriptional regulator n=1 Tax=Halovulum dunhuangense TaxID=1505036 RepID=A0A849L6H6_9RHOB|nr:LysR substrate-binding domain-containing protein [Halovulum dunhuangense]NNU81744.1 LysR family transcriptional regulator [Halovulum dunhuangense]
MDLRDLSYFETIARTATYDEAAEILGRTKQALTKSVRRLEADIGGTLFERDGRGKALTALGIALLERAERLRLSVDDIGREMADLAGGRTGLVRIGTGMTPASHILPAACRQLRAAVPGIRLELEIGNSDFLQERLRHGTLDLILCPMDGGDLSDLDVRVVLDETVVVAAGVDHPLAGRGFELAELTEHGWMLQSQSSAMRAWLDAVFTSRNLAPPRVMVETGTIGVLTRVAEEMQLLTFTSRRNLNTLVELAHPETTMPRQFGLMSRRDAYLPPAARRLREFILATVAAGPA